jgi:hypothetical protein
MIDPFAGEHTHQTRRNLFGVVNHLPGYPGKAKRQPLGF